MPTWESRTMRLEVPGRAAVRRTLLAGRRPCPAPPRAATALPLAVLATMPPQARADSGMGMRTADTPLGARDSALTVLNRLAYGARPGEVDRVASTGVLRWVDQQLSPGRDPARERLESQFEILHLDREELARRFVAAREARREQRAERADSTMPAAN